MGAQDLRKYAIDIPVAVNFFARPDVFEKVFNVIKKARPSKLFLIADGPREGNQEDIINCQKCRKIAENVDWECDVYRLYNDTNKGLWDTYFDSMGKVFEVVDRCIFMEDDVIVSDSFFPYCQYLLDKYKDDMRISFVTAINLYGEYTVPDGDYFFCGECSLTAYGLWKRTFDSMNLEFLKNKYAITAMSDIAKVLKPGYERRIRAYVKNPLWQGHIPHVEVYKNLLRLSQNQLCIVPTKNMVTNIGIASNATHSADDIRKLPKAIQCVFNAERYEYRFPLNDPAFVINDVGYANFYNYIFAWNNPVLKWGRRIEALVRHILYGDTKRVRSKLKQFFCGNIKDE